MSQENVEAIRTAVASGPAALLAILDEEVEWDRRSRRKPNVAGVHVSG
jgi:hypothetical protein